MSVRDMPTMEAASRLAMASIPLERIAKHENVIAWLHRNKGKKLNLFELLRLVSIALKDCYSDVAEAVSCMTGKSREEVDSQTLSTTLEDIDNFCGGNILSFFSLSSSTAQEE